MLSSTASILKPVVKCCPTLLVPFSQLNRTVPEEDTSHSCAQSPVQLPAESPLVPRLQDLCATAMTTAAAARSSQSVATAGAFVGVAPVRCTDTWGKYALELIQLLEKAVARRVQLSSEVHWLHTCSHLLARDMPHLQSLSLDSRINAAQGMDGELSTDGARTTGKCEAPADSELNERPLLAACGEPAAGVGAFMEGRASVGVLFSGGVDSAVLAAIADR